MEGGFQEKKENRAYETRGTPQGGPLSPLLSNIALHGLENHLKQWVENQNLKHIGLLRRRAKHQSLGVIRYADDFVVLHKDEDVIKAAKVETERWLAQTSKLNLKDAKTNIRPTQEGFEFLGWRFIHVNRNQRLRTRIYPSKKAYKQITLQIRQIMMCNRASSAYALIEKLKPVLIGWCNHHRYVKFSKTFQKLNDNVWRKLRHWVFRRRRKQPNRTKLKEKYFPSGRIYHYGGTKHKDNWIFVGTEKGKKGEKREIFLPRPGWVHGKKYVKVRHNKSPYDGDFVYWGKRLNTYV